MFRTVCLRVTIFYLLLFAISANAALDGLVKAVNPNLENMATRLSPAALNDGNLRGGVYKVALAQPVVEVRTSTAHNHDASAVERPPFSKLVWSLACGLAFISVMKRRLSR
ncbi:MAG: hypothetical protein Q7V02_12195 [Methylophilus sp.]|nr:hypothetical protein [Methylophilus sp.]